MKTRWILSAAVVVVATTGVAQQNDLAVAARGFAGSVEPSLPDSPGALRASVDVDVRVRWTAYPAGISSSDDFQAPATKGDSQGVPPEHARHLARTIQPGQIADPWGAKQKFAAALDKQISPGGLASPVFVAGIQHLRDSRPHYGTDSGAYGARIGAAYARQSTQQFLNLGLMSTLLRDDPRYYVLGPTHTFKSRVIYAATRVLITRKDDGGNAVNFPLFVGVVGSQAMTNGFYPDQDRHWGRILTGSLGSIGSKMATQQFKEFGGEIRQHLPFKKKQ